MESNTSRVAGKQQEDDVYLPPGFRFHPTDEELLIDYLKPKVFDRTFSARAIAEVDLNKCEPWELPEKAKIGEKEWYFFSVRDRKYPTGLRTNRATEAGYWKATGKDREIFRKRTSTLIGMKKTLVFYTGRAPKGEKTNWVMHEYRLEGTVDPPRTTKEEWVVSRVFKKNAPGAGKKCLLGLSITSQNDLDSAALLRLLESPSLNPNAMNERTPSLESDSGSAGEHVSCFSSPVKPLKGYNAANAKGFPGRSPYDRQQGALTAAPQRISDIANIIKPSHHPQAIMQRNDTLLNVNDSSGTSPFCNFGRQEYAAQLSSHNALHTLSSYPTGGPTVDFPVCDNMNSLRHDLITPSTVLRSLVDPHDFTNDGMGLKQCKMELPSPFSLENGKVPRMPGCEWINELTINNSALSLQGMFGISPEMHASKPMLSILHDSCLRADMNCDISMVVSKSSTYDADHGRPPSAAAAPVDWSGLLRDC